MKTSHKYVAGIIVAASLGLGTVAHAMGGHGSGMGQHMGGKQGAGMGQHNMGGKQGAGMGQHNMDGKQGMMGEGRMGQGRMGQGAGAHGMAGQTPEARAAIAEKMRAATTPEERRKIAQENRAEMHKLAEAGETRQHRGPGNAMRGTQGGRQGHSH